MFEIRSGENIVAQLAGMKSFPCTDFKTKEPVANEKGEQQWRFTVQIPGMYRFEQYAIKTFSKADPIEGAAMGDSVELAGVTAELGFLSNAEDGSPRQFWRISAESVALKKGKA